MSGTQVVRYSPELKAQVIALWEQCFSSKLAGPRYFEWKYEENPYLDEPVLFVALDGAGNAVGTRGFCGTRWHTADESLVIPCAEDFAIASAYRNTGLATVIMRAALDDLEQRGYEYVINSSAAQATLLQSLAMGWKSIGGMEPVARLATGERIRLEVRKRSQDIRPAPLSRAIHGLSGRSSSFDRLDRVTGQSSAEHGAVIAVESSPQSAAMADLVDRLPNDGRIRHARDPAFFEWRNQDPRREYRFLRYEVDGRTDGYLVLGRRPSASLPIPPFCISDWEGTSSEIRAKLLEFALKQGGLRALYAWTASLTDDGRAILARSGFKPTQPELRARGRPCLLLKELGRDGDWSVGGVSAIDSSHWDVRLIDTMLG